ncbi:class II aldolase/adducin family protein [Sphingomonas naphthae]|uniref:Class II aldolase/adducin family protein n=1 Tax=Sphingomonas naphthae TaxID=1813468 RepID=A0ABY7TNI5_9SPHN|nr:class II aldolase/adducin family protein [Sphingomonas naphthae]WCT74490.1 class II aldolase/adducin family protein [Sphingomonas naphthae]
MTTAVLPPLPPIVDEASARLHLAALYRLIDRHFPSTDGVYNHLSLRVPGHPDLFLMKRHELLYEEVTASNLAVADMTKPFDPNWQVNGPGFVLHGAILLARPDVNCVVHIHSSVGLAMAAHGSGLRMLSQNALRFHNRIGYHDYEGITEDAGEGPRIATALGADGIAVVLRNHGLAIVGNTPRDGFERTRDLLIACETQLMLEATGAPMIEVPEMVREKVARQYVAHDAGRGGADWPAWVRHIDRLDPGYRD